MLFGDRALAHQGRGDGQVAPVLEVGERLVRLRKMHASARNDQRTFGGSQQLGSARDGLAVRRHPV